MNSSLILNVRDILSGIGVETARIEFKATWDQKITVYQVVKTICAFANDLQNLNGGYIVLGVEEKNGVASLPPKGIDPNDFDLIQKEIRGSCNRIDPEYQPVISHEIVDGKHLLVIWAPGSDVRPHKAQDGEKGERKYWVRIGSHTVDAEKNGVLQQLLQMTARVPFDARKALHVRTEELREAKVREFLSDVRSGLLDENDTKDLYRKMRIAAQVNGHDAPLNIGLLFFSDNPEKWFPGSRIEVVQFPANAAGNAIEEKIFRGGLHEQIRSCETYLENISTEHIEKQPGSFRVKGWVSYPIAALREALVNAVYHRSYEGVHDPIKVYLYPDRIEIISYPGPVTGIKLEDLKPGQKVPPVPARNRRIGDFLKELRLSEGRGTGLPKLFSSMKQNGSPEPIFDFDDGRSYFRVTLPSHPEYVAISALRDAAHIRALGDEQGARVRLEDAWSSTPHSATLSTELIRIYGTLGKLDAAEKVYRKFKESADPGLLAHVTNVYVDVLFEAGRQEEAQKVFKDMPLILSANDSLDAAILAKRLGNQKSAHRFFERAGDAIRTNPRALHEFAQTKIALAQNLFKLNRQFNRESNKRLLSESLELLERVLQLDADKTRHAWAWRDLGRVKHWLNAPKSEIKTAYDHAIKLLPGESIFSQELSKWESNA